MFKMIFKKNRGKNYLPNLAKRIKALEDQRVDIGLFKEQGLYDYSKYPYDNKQPLTYTQLASVLEHGNSYTNMKGFHMIPKTMAASPIEKSRLIRGLFKQYLSNINKNSPPIKANAVLEKIGGYYVEKFRKTIGNENILRPLTPATLEHKVNIGTPKPSKPLYGYGTFKKAFSYKINGVVVTP